MIIFWFYAGLLFAAALVFILVPQLRISRKHVDASRTHFNVRLYRERLLELETLHGAGILDTMQFEARRIEAARNLLDDAQNSKHVVSSSLSRTIPLLTALLTPLLALLLYLHWGSLDQLAQARQHTESSNQNIEKVTANLETLLVTSPDSAEGWSLLGRAYMKEGRTTDAARAFERASTLAGRPSELLGRWAYALYFASNKQWTPQLQALTDEALSSNPQEPASLKLRGMAALQAGRYAEAINYWERLLTALPEGDPQRAVISGEIANAGKLAKASVAKDSPLP
ncbi:MAG: c-type cytochrome biogenesis protein CcmI [Burkholderiaceae bacterium]|nr:c-type cytochrome biogenesis protein CcmI [Burkholderiaceae bacterium]